MSTNARTGVLFLNTPMRAPLGADTLVHTRIMQHLDRSRFRPYVACSFGRTDDPTPTYRAVQAIPELEVVQPRVLVLAPTGKAVDGHWPASTMTRRNQCDNKDR